MSGDGRASVVVEVDYPPTPNKDLARGATWGAAFGAIVGLSAIALPMANEVVMARWPGLQGLAAAVVLSSAAGVIEAAHGCLPFLLRVLFALPSWMISAAATLAAAFALIDRLSLIELWRCRSQWLAWHPIGTGAGFEVARMLTGLVESPRIRKRRTEALEIVRERMGSLNLNGVAVWGDAGVARLRNQKSQLKVLKS